MSEPPDAGPASASVVVVGSVNVDLVVRVPTLPRPGETVVGGGFTTVPGGKGANQAVAAAKLGARVWMVGLIGDDTFGRESRRDLEDNGVDVSTLGSSRSPTGVASIIVDDAGENLIAVASGANHNLTAEIVAERLEQVPARSAVLLSNLEVPEAAVIAAATIAADRGWRFVLNPAPFRPVPAHLVGRCDVLTPNENEARALGSVDGILSGGARALVVTRGAKGADVFRLGLPVRHQHALPVDVVDTTGAGDAFSGTLAWSLSEGYDIEESVRLASAAGALACRALGARASLPDREELATAIASWEQVEIAGSSPPPAG
jgi:ribokinase